MPGIHITLRVLDKWNVEELQIASETTVEELVNFVVDQMNLPGVDQDNMTIGYYVERMADGKRLEPCCPFGESGVKEGDTIALKADGVVIEGDEEDAGVNLVDPPRDDNGRVTVNLSVLDVHKVDRVTFDTSQRVEEILKQVIATYNLPLSNPKIDDRHTYTYAISSDALGSYLRDDKTLGDEGVPAGDTLTVHRPADAGATNPPDSRIGRLQKEYSELIKLSRRGSRKGGLLKIEPVNYKEGCPVEEYIVTFKCRGIVGIKDNLKPIYGDLHQVKLTLGSEFPISPPYTRWLTPIWHPNIEHLEPHHACINNENWWPGCRVTDLVTTLGEMVQYKRYHAAWTRPWPLDVEAARWVETYAEPNGIVSRKKPVDRRSLLPDQRIGPKPENSSKNISLDWSKVSPLPGLCAEKQSPRSG